VETILALSTCWLSQRHTDGYAMLREVADLGFGWVELGHGIRVSLVPGLLKALDEGVVRVSSLHNFCPLPAGYSMPAPNLYMPSAADSRERALWLRHTRRTIDFAQKLGARAVVLHLGKVEFFWFSPVRKYRRYLKAKGTVFSAEAPEYKELLAKTMTALRKRMEPYWARVKSGLEELLPYAQERGIRLGLENRESIDELPLDDGFADLFNGLCLPGVAGYWHDAGHAQIKQRLGLVNHAQHLERNADRLLGFHLHDVDAAGKDHQALGSGTIDFASVSRFFRPEHLFVLEYSPRVTPEDVLASRMRAQALLPS
jgi:sugar phosphate isomerase/epimerase